jgi:hypothetical protein
MNQFHKPPTGVDFAPSTAHEWRAQTRANPPINASHHTDNRPPRCSGSVRESGKCETPAETTPEFLDDSEGNRGVGDHGGCSDGRTRHEVLVDLVVQVGFLDKNQAPDEIEIVALTKIWGDALRRLPTDELEPMLWAAFEHDQTRPPRAHNVLAAWNRHCYGQPRETFQEREAREARREGRQLTDGKTPEVPAFFTRHKRLGRCVVCYCAHPCGTRKAASVRPTPRGDRWECASGTCGFSIDANGDE